MTQRIYQVDAFANKVFSGNPAAVCPLDQWLNDDVMQNIAAENNLAETAFFVMEKEDSYAIRWFTPTVEVDLCGHATLAAAFVLFNYEGHQEPVIHFHSHRSGALRVSKHAEKLTLNFPADKYIPVPVNATVTSCFNLPPVIAFRGKTDFMLVYNSEEEIKKLEPRLEAISKLDARGVIVTAKGNKSDFVSRFFAPQSGVNEDPVTGSAHTTLIPYWAGELRKNELTAIQLSSREGFLQCRFLNDRVEISGECRLYLSGQIYIY